MSLPSRTDSNNTNSKGTTNPPGTTWKKKPKSGSSTTVLAPSVDPAKSVSYTDKNTVQVVVLGGGFIPVTMTIHPAFPDDKVRQGQWIVSTPYEYERFKSSSKGPSEEATELKRLEFLQQNYMRQFPDDFRRDTKGKLVYAVGPKPLSRKEALDAAKKAAIDADYAPRLEEYNKKVEKMVLRNLTPPNPPGKPSVSLERSFNFLPISVQGIERRYHDYMKNPDNRVVAREKFPKAEYINNGSGALPSHQKPIPYFDGKSAREVRTFVAGLLTRLDDPKQIETCLTSLQEGIVLDEEKKHDWADDETSRSRTTLGPRVQRDASGNVVNGDISTSTAETLGAGKTSPKDGSEGK